MAEQKFDLTRDTLAIVFLFALIAASLWIMWPFLAAVVWATMIVVATWPILVKLQRWLLGRRWLAVTGMTLLLSSCHSRSPSAPLYKTSAKSPVG
jgi:predicted PurR-regulated permease PerM